MHWTAFARDTGRNRWYRCPSELDGAQVKKLMLRHDGCVALKANTWSESTFTALQPLPVEQRGAYCVLKTVELVYLLCSVHPLPI